MSTFNGDSHENDSIRMDKEPFVSAASSDGRLTECRINFWHCWQGGRCSSRDLRRFRRLARDYVACFKLCDRMSFRLNAGGEIRFLSFGREVDLYGTGELSLYARLCAVRILSDLLKTFDQLFRSSDRPIRASAQMPADERFINVYLRSFVSDTER